MIPIFLSFLLVISACTPQKAERSEPKPVLNESDPNWDKSSLDTSKSGINPAEAALIVPFIPGLVIRHRPESKPRKKGTFTYIADLQIIEQESGKMVAEFPEQVWGEVAVKFEKKSLGIFFTDEKGSEFEYRVKTDDRGRIVESAKCHFYEGNNKKSSYEILFPSEKGTEVDWEATVSQLSRLARMGNSYAYNFFMSPTEEQKKYHKHDDGAASFKNIQRILGFMKKHGCKWQK